MLQDMKIEVYCFDEMKYNDHVKKCKNQSNVKLF